MEYAEVDRRPWRVYNAYGGNYDTSVTGGANWWEATDAVATLIGYIDADHAAGWRGFIINRPGGDVPRNNDVVSVAAFHCLQSWKQADIVSVLGPYWTAGRASDSRLGIYGGFLLPDGDSLSNPCLGDYNALDAATCPVTINTRVPDLSLTADLTFETGNWDEWIAAGVDLRIADNSSTSGHYAGLTSLRTKFTVDEVFGVPVQVAGEGIVNASHLPDGSRIEDGPYFAIESFVLSHEASAGQSWNGLIDAKVTQVMLAFQSDSTATRSTIRDRMAGGFVCVDFNAPDAVSAAILDLGTVPDVTDAAAVRNGGTVNLSWAKPTITESDGTPVTVSLVRIWVRTSPDADWTLLYESTGTSYADARDGVAYYKLTVWTQYNAQSPGIELEVGAGDGGSGGLGAGGANPQAIGRPRGRGRQRGRMGLESVGLGR